MPLGKTRIMCATAVTPCLLCSLRAELTAISPGGPRCGHCEFCDIQVAWGDIQGISRWLGGISRCTLLTRSRLQDEQDEQDTIASADEEGHHTMPVVSEEDYAMQNPLRAGGAFEVEPQTTSTPSLLMAKAAKRAARGLAEKAFTPPIATLAQYRMLQKNINLLLTGDSDATALEFKKLLHSDMSEVRAYRRAFDIGFRVRRDIVYSAEGKDKDGLYQSPNTVGWLEDQEKVRNHGLSEDDVMMVWAFVFQMPDRHTTKKAAGHGRAKKRAEEVLEGPCRRISHECYMTAHRLRAGKILLVFCFLSGLSPSTTAFLLPLLEEI